MKNDRARIVVTGLAATYPYGGVFWDYLQYALGFARLGHDVLYLEDTGKWCYSPTRQTFVERGDDNARRLGEQLGRLEPPLGDRWSYRDATGRTFGRSDREVHEFCRTADLFLHISASCWMREEYFAAGAVAFIDSDPMYTQSSVPDVLAGTATAEAVERVEMLQAHDVFFTFAERIGEEDCRVPNELFDWIPTRQPVVIDAFESHRVPIDQRRAVLTTVGSWEPHEGGPVVRGRPYGSKRDEFERFLDLPRHSALPLELALSGRYPADRLNQAGWHVRDAYAVSSDPWVYRDYLARSAGEWSVAKNAYVASRSGWFSCRSACYLALGVPVVVQDTGFSDFLPTGDGLMAFHTFEEATEAIAKVASEPGRHAEAAARIAREHFDSDAILTHLLEKALNRDHVR